MVASDGPYLDDGWGQLVQKNRQLRKDLELVMEYATLLERGQHPRQVPTVLFDYQLRRGRSSDTVFGPPTTWPIRQHRMRTLKKHRLGGIA